jgi:hypothetical protein
MKRTLNFWIDVVIYLLMGFLLFSGFLMKFTMPPGTGGRLLLLGLDRHGWGVLHFWVAVSLLTGVALHLWLHWAWMRTTTPHYFKRAWAPALIALLILALAALAAPFAVKPVVVPGGGEKHEAEMAASVADLIAPGGEAASAKEALAEPASSEASSAAPADDCATCGADCPDAGGSEEAG